MSLFANWDTALVLTAILGPLCILLSGICWKQWTRNVEIKHEHHATLAKLQETERRFDDYRNASEPAIKRQQKEIECLKGKIAKLETDIAARDNDSPTCGSDR
jgi:hypothetical protein